MKRFVSCIALVALAACVAAKGTPEERKVLHVRTGHFARIEALEKSYHLYSAAFGPVLPKEDYENFRPSEQTCYHYLQSLLDRDVEIEKLVDFIKFDACLGVLYEDEPYLYEDQKTRKELADNVAFFVPYKETKIEEMSHHAQHCIGNLLTAAVHGQKQFEGYNDNFIQLFVQLGECTDEHISAKDLEDPYLKIIYDLVRKEAKLALAATVRIVKDFTENMFDTQLSKSKDRVLSFFKMTGKNGARSDRIDKEWPVEVYKLLSITQAPFEQLTIRSVHEKVKKFLDGEKYYKVKGLTDPNEKTLQNNLNSFLALIGDKATSDLVRESYRKRLGTYGVSAFDDWKAKLCKPFQYTDKQNGKRDFALRLQRLIDITAYQDLFDIDEEYMLTNVLKNAGKTSAIYLSLSVCNILDFTSGSLNQEIRKGTKWSRMKDLKYNVGLFNRENMIRWPVLKYI